MSQLFSRPAVRDALTGAALLAAMLALIVYPQQAMAAARDGLVLCYNVIIPSLFPFFVLSSLVVELGLAAYLGRLLEGVMLPLFRVNGACASAFALGFVGGYPVGARTAISLYEKGLCTKTEAERLLAFCNKSGPAFILGVVGAGIFSSSRVGLMLYLAHALASVCVGVLFRFYRAGEAGGGRPVRSHPIQTACVPVALTQSVKSSFLSTLNICAFVVFFTVVIRLLDLSGLLPGLADLLGRPLAFLGFDQLWARRLLTGLIELSSGVWTLSGAPGLAGRVSMAAFMLGWAGLSVHCQVLSFIGGSGLNLRTYLMGKLLHGGISAGLTALLLRLFPISAPVSSYLTDQLMSITAMDFSSSLTISLSAVWAMWLFFLLASLRAVGKNSGKRRRHTI